MNRTLAGFTALGLCTAALAARAEDRQMMQFGGQEFDSIGLMFTMPFGGQKQADSLFQRAQPSLTLGLAQFMPPERLCQQESCAARPVLPLSYQISLDSIVEAASAATAAPLSLDLSRFSLHAPRPATFAEPVGYPANSK